MHNQNSRVSMITQHNIYQQTDQLYNPLRKALLKSQFPIEYVSHFSQINQNNSVPSHVSRTIYPQKPVQPEKLIRTTFIPIDRELVPTNHMEKVAGKQFYVMNVQQKMGNPLTSSQFQHANKDKVQEIVYQFKDTNNYPSTISMTSERIKAQNQSKIKKLKEAYAESNPNDRIQTIQTVGSTRQLPRPTLITGGNQTLGDYTVRTYTAQPSLVGRQNDSLLNSGVQPYRFKSDMISEGSLHGSKLRNKKKNEYKYNLYSMLDEPLNNGCNTGCFSNNEFCASKIPNHQWN